jgi:CheY-like chemotaxis protein
MSGQWAGLTNEHCLPRGVAMPNKALTILIADEQHLQRLYIEKMLNQLGYHRIVPVQTFEEVQILTAIPAEPFDVLIINAGLLVDTCEPQPQARHVLVYDHLDLCKPTGATPAVLVRLPGVPDNVNLEHFMDIIDPPEAATGLRVLPWLRELSRQPVAGV